MKQVITIDESYHSSLEHFFTLVVLDMLEGLLNLLAVSIRQEDS